MMHTTTLKLHRNLIHSNTFPESVAHYRLIKKPNERFNLKLVMSLSGVFNRVPWVHTNPSRAMMVRFHLNRAELNVIA